MRTCKPHSVVIPNTNTITQNEQFHTKYIIK